jgi:hypothetical protein
VAGRVGHDERAPRRGEVAVRDVDRDALLALGGEAVEEQGEVEVAAAGPRAPRVGLERRDLVGGDELGLEEQPPDERALAVVDAAAGQEPQQPGRRGGAQK